MNTTQNVLDIYDQALNEKRTSQLAKILTLIFSFASGLLGFNTVKYIAFAIIDSYRDPKPQITWRDIQKQRRKELLISQIYNKPRSYELSVSK
jgi:hypothetical protein